MKARYDVVIIGSGLGGLVSGVLLAKEGFSVCVLEKNNQFGGNLQTFVRDKTIFDTGVHYIGGLAKGENLNRVFSYLGIMEDLRLKQMDQNGFDRISFGQDVIQYPHAQSHWGFVQELSVFFPEERANLEKYCALLQAACDAFPLYNLDKARTYDDSVLRLNAREVIESVTQNEMLRAVLAGTNFLYAGMGDKSPFYVHALAVNSYIKSAHRCINGGSQITKQLIRQLKKHGGETYKYSEVTSLNIVQNRVASIALKDGSSVAADVFISNIELKTLLDLAGPEHFRKPFYNRVKRLESTISAFSVYIVLEPGTFAYFNHNLYHFDDPSQVWSAQDYNQNDWPRTYMVSVNASDKQDNFADGMTILTYMRFEEVAEWENSFNTVAEKARRDSQYEAFKEAKAAKLIDEVAKKFPNLKSCIRSVHTSTPLSYRDYIGSDKGNMYGYVKDASNPMLTMLPLRPKLDNLYLTGQSVSTHGILGVTLGAVRTCGEILGHEYLIDKIAQ